MNASDEWWNSDASEEEKSMEGFSQSVFKVVDIKVVNLAKFLESEGIEVIDFYYSDCQGSDLTVLKTLKKNFITPNKINQMFI